MADEARVESERTDVSKCRLASFLSLHLVSFSAQIAAMINFINTRDYFFFCFLLLPFLFSGFFCAHAAWHSSLSGLKCGLMPLKDQPLPVAMILAVPLGLFQLVIVLLSIDEQLSSNANAGHARPAGLSKPPSSRFHCKAVNGIFEGILSSAVLLYAYWSLDFPKGDEITKSEWTGEKHFLAIVGLIPFFQAGIGLMELDFCTSIAISKRRQSIWYEFMHFLFRVCEVTSRVSIFIGFMVNARQKIWWWWVPLAAEFAISMLLVAIYGGAEKTWMVRILCAIPCAFANPFLFIDSPQKRRAAKMLSRWLTVRHAAQLIVLPILLFVSVEGVDTDVQAWWSMHVGTNIISAVAIPLYWALLVFVTWGNRDSMADIFSVCEKGYPNELDRLTKNAVGLNINCFDVEGWTPLMYAAVTGHDQVCCSLLQKGAKVDIRLFRRPGSLGPSCRSIVNRFVRLEWTALHMAAHKGHPEVVRALLDEGLRDGEPDVEDRRPSVDWQNFIDTQGNTPLHVAASYGHAEVARLLVARQPGWADVRNRQGKTPVELAKQGRVRQAIRAPADGCENGRIGLLSQQSGLGNPRDQAWPMIHLNILHLGDDLSAPGLCSYITSSGGGSLGRVFLAKVEQVFANVVADIDPNDIEPIDKNRTPLKVFPSRVASRCGWGADPLLDEELATMQKFDSVPKEALLGSGTYRKVWRAMDTKTNKEYAVKNIDVSRGAASAIAIRERQVGERISVQPHPCIVYLHKTIYFSSSSFYSLIMDFCPGGELTDKIREARTEAQKQNVTYTPPPLARPWLGQIFLGLEHLHKRMKTLFRDLKPENCVLSAQGVVKLTDFGLGLNRIESRGRQAVWEFNAPPGSPGYIAPEALKQQDFTEKVDLYSFGVVAWVLLTGGVKNRKNPQPPCSQMLIPNAYEVFYKDCQALSDCIEDPESHNAVALADQASRDFVKKLTCEQASERMDHARIRDHEFMAPVKLPPFEARRDGVEAWLSVIVET